MEDKPAGDGLGADWNAIDDRRGDASTGRVEATSAVERNQYLDAARRGGIRVVTG